MTGDEKKSGSRDADTGTGRRLAGWGVHLFTASGIVAGLLAIDAVIGGDFRAALLWLGLAMIIDGFDGPMARRLEIARHVPQFDGAVLDLVIDYVTYTVIPALMIYRFGLVPEGWELPAAAAIMTTSLYTFGNRQMKTSDNYFSGFPATWNLVVLCFFVLRTDPSVNLAVIGILCVLTFVPIKFVHPFRVAAWRPLTISLTALWAILSVWLVIVGAGDAPPARAAPAAYWAWIACSLYVVGLGLRRSWAGASGES